MKQRNLVRVSLGVSTIAAVTGMLVAGGAAAADPTSDGRAGSDTAVDPPIVSASSAELEHGLSGTTWEKTTNGKVTLTDGLFCGQNNQIDPGARQVCDRARSEGLTRTVRVELPRSTDNSCLATSEAWIAVTPAGERPARAMVLATRISLVMLGTRKCGGASANLDLHVHGTQVSAVNLSPDSLGQAYELQWANWARPITAPSFNAGVAVEVETTYDISMAADPKAWHSFWLH